MNNESFLIEKERLSTAQDICRNIEDKKIRLRAAANVLAAKLADDYFADFNADTASGIHNTPEVLENIDIADIYLQDTYIDVRLHFEDNDLCVPKCHFDNNMLPAAYMFVKIDENYTNASVTGFITPGSIDRITKIDGYYGVDIDSLLSFCDIEPLLTAQYDEGLSPETEIKIHNFIDGDLTDSVTLFKYLITSKEARTALIRTSHAKRMFKEIIDEQGLNNVTPDEADNSHTVTEEYNNADSDNDSDINTLQSFDENFSLEEADTDIDALSDEGASIDLSSDFEPLPLLDEETEVSEISLSEETESNTEDFEASSDTSDKLLIPDEVALVEDSTDDESEITEISEVAEEIPDNELNSEKSFETEYADSVDLLDLTENDDSQNEINLTEPAPETEPESILDEADVQSSPEIDFAEDIPDNETEDVPATETEIIQDQSEDTESESDQELSENTEDFATEITPSLNEIEQIASDQLSVEDLEDTPPSEVSNNTDDHQSPDLNNLFTSDSQDIDSEPQEIIEGQGYKKQKKSPIIPFLGFVLIAGALGYFGYTKYAASQMPAEEQIPVEQTVSQDNETKQEEAMPLETVENAAKDTSKAEAVSVSIPAIENNLDASILVSNLSVNWEVPAGYITNNSARRYFTKVGKIIQLNLKTELLLLNKPPINNKIVLELGYNTSRQAFEIKGVTTSSGEQNVDDLITDTVKKVLDMKLNMNTGAFGNIPGNPMLIIKL